MTLFQMAAAIAACDAAMVLEGVEQATRERVLERFGKSMALAAFSPGPRIDDAVRRVRQLTHGDIRG